MISVQPQPVDSVIRCYQYSCPPIQPKLTTATSIATWWLIPLSKWVITPVISGLTLLIPCITGVITHLLSGMSHQVQCCSRDSFKPHLEDTMVLAPVSSLSSTKLVGSPTSVTSRLASWSREVSTPWRSRVVMANMALMAAFSPDIDVAGLFQDLYIVYACTTVMKVL